MAKEIVQWLNELGLGQYAPAFADNEIDLDVLPELTEDDLRELGLPMGPRKKLLRALSLQPPPPNIDEPESGASTSGTVEAERRQLTVMFCDLVGSTALSAKLDPEDMRDVLLAYQDACSNVIARYDGYVAKFMGDGVFAYFGYPTAHEDDAERAITTGLGIVDAVAGLEHDLAVRIGIATGNVAVGDLIGEGASEEANVVGEAPNLAARLQAIAEPNTVIIGEATHALAGGMFETQILATQELKGFAGPVGAWRVLRPSSSESRFQATRSEQLTEFVGRDEELEILLRRWERAKAGDGQAVFIAGEPGIGKSRLVHALRERIEDDAYYVRVQQCSPLHTQSAFFPFADQTARAIGLTSEDSNSVKIDKLESWIRGADQPVEKHAPLFGQLLGIDTSERYAALNVLPQRQRQLLFEAFEDRIKGITSKGPFLYVVEDCHWLDPTSLEQLGEHLEIVPGRLAALIIVTYRPEFEAPWVGQANTTLITLNRLDRAQCAAMVKNIGGDSGLSAEIIDNIAERTDGVPLFVEELTKAVLEASEDGRTAAELAVPASLQDSLEARLDRLGPAKDIAQIGAVIGRSFDYDLLSRTASLDDTALNKSLGVLVSSGLAIEQGIPPSATYTFKHALIQDTAYQSLLRDRRRELHDRVAGALRESAEQGMPTQPEVIGFHFAEAGSDRQGAQYFMLAGRQAYETWAVEEGLSHLTRALELIDCVPEDRERLELEAETFRVRGLTRKAVDGVASEDARADLERSMAIGRQIGKISDVLPVLANMANTEAAQGRFEDAAKNSETVLEFAKTYDDIPAEVAANFMQGIVQFHTGDNIRAEAYFRRCIELTQTPGFDMDFKTWSFEPKIGARFRLGNTLLVEGYPDQGAVLAGEALALAQNATPLGVVSALMYGCFTLIWRGDVSTVRDWAEEAQGIADEHGFAQHQGWSNVAAGWAHALLGKSREGLKEIDTGIERFRNSGRKTWLAWWLMVRADAELHNNEAERAEATIEEALGSIGEIGENQFLSPANSLRGDVLRELGRIDACEDAYLGALDIARDQSGKSWELRAANRLARLWQSQGKVDEARDLLAPLYGWFTEGFDTIDLKDAKSLLDELS